MIQAISLQNFKAFRKTTVPLGQLTLLSGLNGSGKSTLLQALGLIRQSWDAGFLMAGDLLLNGDLVELGTGSDVLHHEFENPVISICIGVKTAIDDGNLIWRAPIETEADVLKCDASPGGIGRPTEGGQMQIFNLLDHGFQFLRADRITPSVTFPKSHHAVRKWESLGPRGEFTAHCPSSGHLAQMRT